MDWGEKRIGLAISRDYLAEPYGVVSTFEELTDVIGQEGIEQVVLGVPEGEHEGKVRGLGKKIEKEFGVPVVLRSEILTTREAQRKLIEAGKSKKRRRELDSASAALILQEYLDEKSK